MVPVFPPLQSQTPCHPFSRNYKVLKHNFFTSHSNLPTFLFIITVEGGVSYRGGTFTNANSGVCWRSSEHLAALQPGPRQVRYQLHQALLPDSIHEASGCPGSSVRWILSTPLHHYHPQCPAHNGQ